MTRPSDLPPAGGPPRALPEGNPDPIAALPSSRIFAALLSDLRSSARRLARSGEDADDLVQDTLLRVWARMAMAAHGGGDAAAVEDLRAYAFATLRHRAFQRAPVARPVPSERASEPEDIAAPRGSDGAVRLACAEAVLWADEHLVVADKPHFLPVTPSGGYVADTLLARLLRRLDNPQLVPLHRIDRATAGLVLFSANAQSRARYQQLFPARAIDKTYEALAAPLPMLSFPQVRRSRLLPGQPFFRTAEVAGMANSETHIGVIERHASYWRYSLQPVTGRQHQLRVHMAALGAPIFNDRWYPELCEAAPDDLDRPLQLLAKSLSFIDPVDGRPRHFESNFRLTAATD